MSQRIDARTKQCMIIGDPVEHSLSPTMHNAAYASLKIDDQFVFTAARVTPEDLPMAVNGIRALSFRGLTVTIPHKQKIALLLDELDETAVSIGAVNTVVNENGHLIGYNTDWLGTVTPLREAGVDLNEKRVALIGAGGAARAMLYGVLQEGAQATIFNRTLEKAEALAADFSVEAKPLTELFLVPEYEVIINSTSLGMGELTGETPVPQQHLRPHQVVFDAVYRPHTTRLLQEAQEVGAKVIHGAEMLLHQGTAQFELYTGMKAPVEVMRKALN